MPHVTQAFGPRQHSGPRRSSETIEHLVDQAARGEQQAWSDLIDEFSGLIWTVARSHGLDSADAADVVQTTWLRLCENIDRLKCADRVGAWLATTARRESLRVVAAAARQVPHGDDLPQPVSDTVPIEAALAAAAAHRVLWQAVGRLGSRDQELLRLLVADPAPSYEEIGERLHMPIGSIGPTRARCLERLRREAIRLGVVA